MNGSEKEIGTSAGIVRDLIVRLFTSLVEDAQRAQSLLRDAMPKIVADFQGLQEQVREHVALVDQLATKLQGNEKQAGFVETMRVFIDTFVKDLVDVSQQGVRITERVTLVGHEVNLVIANVGEIDEMARTTRFIALNAHIEANRSGEAGKSFLVVADEIKRLAGDAEQFSSHIRDAVDRCQARLNETKSMVGVLAAHDMKVALSVQNGLVETVTSIDQANRSLRETLRSLDARVRSAIQALQFDDILMQLLTGIERRLSQLQNIWVDALPASMGSAEAVRLVDAYEKHKSVLETRQIVPPPTESSLSEHR